MFLNNLVLCTRLKEFIKCFYNYKNVVYLG